MARQWPRLFGLAPSGALRLPTVTVLNLVGTSSSSIGHEDGLQAWDACPARLAVERVAASLGLAIEDSLSLRGQRAEDGHNHEQGGIVVPRSRLGEFMGKHNIIKDAGAVAYHVAVIISLSLEHSAEQRQLHQRPGRRA